MEIEKEQVKCYLAKDKSGWIVRIGQSEILLSNRTSDAYFFPDIHDDVSVSSEWEQINAR